MHEVFTNLCAALTQTADRVEASASITTTLKDQTNWQFPAITRSELAEWPRQIAESIISANSDDEPANLEVLQDFPRRLGSLQIDTIPHMYANYQGVYAYTATLDALERALMPTLGMVRIDDSQLMPGKTARRLKAVNRTMDQIDVDHSNLVVRVEGINSAYRAAQSLPTTLQELDDARSELDEIRQKIETLYLECAKTQGKIESSSDASEEKLQKLKEHALEAESLIKKCEDAYQITTTKGLAAAFDQRASRLNVSISLWVVGLLIALWAGTYVGTQRINALTVLISVPNLSWGQVTLHMLFAVLGIGAPLWFAWLATKQIGQRFRLAEDYAFKASVAKAYEGYRKQAALYDEEFSARLFGSALTRLEEAPLRLVEQDAHGSPLHEFMQSSTIKRAMSSVPDFQEKIMDLAKQSLAQLSKTGKGKAADDSPV